MGGERRAASLGAVVPADGDESDGTARAMTAVLVDVEPWRGARTVWGDPPVAVSFAWRIGGGWCAPEPQDA
jgi:hypothetical protein